MEYIKILSALLSPIVAITTIIMGVNNHKLNKIKIKHDLYDRRLNIYYTTREYLKYVTKEDTLDRVIVEAFVKASQESKFLFKNDVSDFLSEIWQNSLILEYCTECLYHSRDKSDYGVIKSFLDKSDFKEYIINDDLKRLEDILIFEFAKNLGELNSIFNNYLCFENY